MPKPPQQLIDKWYRKLKDSGFDDIEQNEDKLKTWDSHYFITQYGRVKFDAKEEYYQMAGKFLHDHKFESKLHKLVWEYHCEGIVPMKMKDKLAKKGFHYSWIRLYQIISDLEREMLRDLRQK